MNDFDEDATRRLLYDLEHIKSPWYWLRGYVQVGCLILLLAVLVAAAWLLVG